MAAGYCRPTFGAGDCTLDGQGAWLLTANESDSWHSAHSTCHKRCAQCPRCRYFSYSPLERDCSWYATCDLTQLMGRNSVRRLFRTNAFSPAPGVASSALAPAPAAVLFLIREARASEGQYGNLSFSWGSTIMRGLDTARLLGASLSLCRDAGPGFAVYVHVKAPCHQALQHRGRHVLDVVDGLKEFGGGHTLQASQRLVALGFDAQMFNSEHEVQLFCAAPRCHVVPHFFNLQRCAKEGQRRPRVPSAWLQSIQGRRPLKLGLVGYQSSFHGRPEFTLPPELGNHKARLVHEGRDTCAFFAQVDVAIAWVRRKLDNPHKPAERFTNPIVLGIPTIGNPYFKSHTAFASASNFTCSSEQCVAHVIARLHAGELDAGFRRLQSEVWAAVSPARVKRDLLTFLLPRRPGFRQCR
jgi:hypothetical protein